MVRLKTSALIVLWAILSVLTSAQNVSVKASVDSARYQIGDYINYRIEVNAQKGINLTVPSIKDSLSGIELLKSDSPAVKEEDGKTITTYSFTLAKYDSGDVRIPPVAVKYTLQGDTSKKSVLTNEVKFTVSSLQVSQGSDIKDIKDPIKIPLDWKVIALWILVALILIAAAYFAYRYYMKKKAERAGIITVIKKEPHETALDSLKALEEKKLWQSGKIKEYHSEITQIIRRYFEDRFNVPALESTTNELLGSLRKADGASKVIDITSDFLNNADLVKFAKFVPMNDINEEMMKEAYIIVNLTLPKSVESQNPQQQEALDV